MNREMVENIYYKSTTEAVESDDSSTAWVWEENMVKNTILELKYALSVNHHALTFEQMSIINNTFGEI